MPKIVARKSGKFKARDIKTAALDYIQNGDLEVVQETTRSLRGLKVIKNPFYTK